MQAATAREVTPRNEVVDLDHRCSGPLGEPTREGALPRASRAIDAHDPYSRDRSSGEYHDDFVKRDPAHEAILVLRRSHRPAVVVAVRTTPNGTSLRP